MIDRITIQQMSLEDLKCSTNRLAMFYRNDFSFSKKCYYLIILIDKELKKRDKLS